MADAQPNPSMAPHSIKTSIIGRSPAGNAVISFENDAMLAAWKERNPNHRIRFFTQTITETLVSLD